MTFLAKDITTDKIYSSDLLQPHQLLATKGLAANRQLVHTICGCPLYPVQKMNSTYFAHYPDPNNACSQVARDSRESLTHQNLKALIYDAIQQNPSWKEEIELTSPNNKVRADAAAINTQTKSILVFEGQISNQIDLQYLTRTWERLDDFNTLAHPNVGVLWIASRNSLNEKSARKLGIPIAHVDIVQGKPTTVTYKKTQYPDIATFVQYALNNFSSFTLNAQKLKAKIPSTQTPSLAKANQVIPPQLKPLPLVAQQMLAQPTLTTAHANQVAGMTFNTPTPAAPSLLTMTAFISHCYHSDQIPGLFTDYVITNPIQRQAALVRYMQVSGLQKAYNDLITTNLLTHIEYMDSLMVWAVTKP